MNLELLLAQHQDRILFSAIVGSHAYGLATADSDVDMRGIYMVPAFEYLSLMGIQHQVSDSRNDTVYYTLRRFLELASQANPNVLELLFMPTDCIKIQTPWMNMILNHRHGFMTSQCVDTHIGYANTQIKKARGQNKWVNNPQPEAIPLKEDFCWVILNVRPDQMNQGSYPMRPVSLRQASINLDEYHCAAVEHGTSLYRLYHYGSKAKGVFRNGMLVCESIPKSDEWRYFSGVLIFNEDGWRRAKKDHENYWQWRKNRNEKRWEKQETGMMDYDAKNMMHTIRLLLSGEHILTHGEPRVRFAGKDNELLLSIRQGKLGYDEILALAESIISHCHQLKIGSNLPPKSNLNDIQ